jgi:hypothetical protein
LYEPAAVEMDFDEKPQQDPDQKPDTATHSRKYGGEREIPKPAAQSPTFVPRPIAPHPFASPTPAM